MRWIVCAGEGLAQSDAGPEPGAQSGSSARWDLCGGPPERAVSTASSGGSSAAAYGSREQVDSAVGAPKAPCDSGCSTLQRPVSYHTAPARSVPPAGTVAEPSPPAGIVAGPVVEAPAVPAAGEALGPVPLTPAPLGGTTSTLVAATADAETSASGWLPPL